MQFPLAAICTFVIITGSVRADDRLTAYHYLNRIRELTGLAPFKENQNLEKAAKNHASYLSINNIASHFEKSDRSGYTGRKPDDRALYAGYDSRAVTENFSLGQSDAAESIDGLMSAIYHRFGFLDFSKNEVGIGIMMGKHGSNYVYKMGNDRLNRFCRLSVYTDDGSFYADTCKHNEKVSAKNYDEIELDIQKQSPPTIIWPTDDAEDIPVVFYEEIPDPLPDMAVSGYPISIQLNPYYFRNIKILRFKLFDHQSGMEIKPVRLLSHKLDPNHLLTPYQFALFPLQRLDWNRWYRAEVLLKANRKQVSFRWKFKTKNLAVPIFRITAQNERLLLKAHQTYAIHIPPSPRFPVIKHLRWEATSTSTNQIEWEDKNTILVALSGDRCEEIRFKLDGNRSFFLEIAETDNLNHQHQYPDKLISSCAQATMNRLPGFRIQANGELLQVQSGKTYWVEIKTPDQPLTEVKWRYPEGMDIQLNQISKNVITLELSGTSGQTATFLLSKSQAFKVQLK